MLQYALKVLVLALLIVAVTEVAKRWPFWAAVATSVPAVSIAAIILLYLDLGDSQRAATLSHAMFWLCFPSLALLGGLPLFLKLGWNFWPSFAAACGAFAVVFAASLWVMNRLGLGPA
jgi:hypothetical protein